MSAILFQKPKRKVSTVFLHCSASDNPKHDNVETIRQWHLARGFADIGYHFYINKLGQILVGRNLEKIPAAQEGYNRGAIAICCGGEKEFTDIQLEALKRLCAEIKREMPQVTFHGHCEVNPHKTCPNYDYKTLLADIMG